jgi:SOS-response transcriptional repressor LexA
MADTELVDFAKRLEQSLDKPNFPQKGKGRGLFLSDLFGISPQAVSKWLSGDVLPIKRINEIAEKLHVNPHWLLTGHGNMNPHSRVIYAPCAPSNEETELHNLNWQKVPIIQWDQAQNWNKKAVALNEQTQYIWATTETSSPHFALVIEDDSMQPRFFPGNILIFDPSLQPVHKNRVLIYWKKNNQVTCGILVFNGPTTLLMSHNPDYKPIPLEDPNEFEILAVCRQVFIIDK